MEIRMQKLMHNMKAVTIISPVSTGAAQGGNYGFISMKNAQHASINIRCGILTGAAAAVTLQQAKNVEGNGNKALGFTKVWMNVPTVSNVDEQDLWTEVDVAANTFNTASNRNYRIELDAAELDVDNSFDCFRLHLSAAGTSLVVAADATLTNLRYTGEGNLSQPSAKIN